VPTDASALYARNVYNFLSLLLDPKTGEFKIDKSDDLVGPTLAVDAGTVVKRG
jgi:NAD(P) transhydrogenase subunit alpha